MRALLKYRPAGFAAAFCAAAAAAGVATAQDDIGFRLDTLLPALGFAPAAEAGSAPPAPQVPHPRRHARRIWAAAASRPLRIAFARRQLRPRAAQTHVRTRAAARLRHPVEPQVIFPKLATLPMPPRPAVVSIFQDHTLRGGDAVMMADGVHVFHPSGAWPHRPAEFERLRFTAALGWQLRRTLDAYDKNPPTRWSSEGSWTG